MARLVSALVVSLIVGCGATPGAGSTGSSTTTGTLGAGSGSGSGGSGATTTGGTASGGTSGSAVSGALGFPVLGGFARGDATQLSDGGMEVVLDDVGGVLLGAAVTCEEVLAYDADGGGGLLASLGAYPDISWSVYSPASGTTVQPGTYDSPLECQTYRNGVCVTDSPTPGIEWFNYGRNYPDAGTGDRLTYLSGSITYTTVSFQDGLAGSFDVMVGYPDGGDPTSVSGSFNVAFCPIP